MNKIDNKGFTLVELLAVLVILVAIMGIAIPSISSSLERTKSKQNESRYQLLKSSAELYVTDHKNAIYKKLDDKNIASCYIVISQMHEEGILTEEEMKDADGIDLSGHYIIFTRPNTYEYRETTTVSVPCVG